MSEEERDSLVDHPISTKKEYQVLLVGGSRDGYRMNVNEQRPTLTIYNTRDTQGLSLSDLAKLGEPNVKLEHYMLESIAIDPKEIVYFYRSQTITPYEALVRLIKGYKRSEHER